MSKHDILDVVDQPALGQIGIAAAVHKTDATDVDGLLPNAISRPPTLILALPSAVMICGMVTLKVSSLSKSTSTSYCLVVPPQEFTATTPGTV